MKVSVFGLGIIGGIWARHYEAAGQLAAAWNRSPKPDTPKWQADIVAAAEAGELLHIVVADPPAVLATIEAMAPALGPGKIVVQSSTIDPASSDRCRAAVESKGARYVEAPFTGSKPAAEERKTVFFLGGDAGALDTVEPVLATVSAIRFRIGTNAQASALKLAMNLQIAGLMEALCEGLTFARRAGITDDKFFEVLGANVANSGLVKLKEPKLRAADFAPQFSVKHMGKDVRLAVETAGAESLPQTALVRDRLRSAEARGWGDEDFSAILKLL